MDTGEFGEIIPSLW